MDRVTWDPLGLLYKTRLVNSNNIMQIQAVTLVDACPTTTKWTVIWADLNWICRESSVLIAIKLKESLKWQSEVCCLGKYLEIQRRDLLSLCVEVSPVYSEIPSFINIILYFHMEILHSLYSLCKNCFKTLLFTLSFNYDVWVVLYFHLIFHSNSTRVLNYHKRDPNLI